MQRKFSALLLLTSFALSGCGVTGSLKTPPPLFGGKIKPSEQIETKDNTQDSFESEEDRELNDILDEIDD